MRLLFRSIATVVKKDVFSFILKEKNKVQEKDTKQKLIHKEPFKEPTEDAPTIKWWLIELVNVESKIKVKQKLLEQT